MNPTALYAMISFRVMQKSRKEMSNKNAINERYPGQKHAFSKKYTFDISAKNLNKNQYCFYHKNVYFFL